MSDITIYVFIFNYMDFLPILQIVSLLFSSNSNTNNSSIGHIAATITINVLLSIQKKITY